MKTEKQNKFFTQSYKSALDDFIFSCTNLKNNRWNWIILTASNENQAEAYRLQINKRIDEYRLPLGTKFSVISDYQGKRIGSGGATLNVIKHIAMEIGVDDLYKQKILVIHSGGDSKRIPQYSACGKIFAPVPRMLPNGNISTIFDELIIAATDIPNRCGKGMMIFPSDTEVLFNSLQLDLLSCDAAGLSIKSSVIEGQDHGVFVQGEDSHDHRNNDVSFFMHKQSENRLRLYGAVDNSDQVNIDTGCIWLSSKIVYELYGLISTDNKIDERKFCRFVNQKVCLNFYADFVYPLATQSTLEDFYKETPENGYSDELRVCRKEIWKRLSSYKLSLVKMIPGRYIHFGMTHEMYNLLVNDISEYSYLNWKPRLNTNAKKGTIINSYISEDTALSSNCYIEDSIVLDCSVGEGSILSNVDIENIKIPANTVFHALKLKNGKYVCRIYGRDDNPKSSYDAPFLTETLAKLIDKMGVEKDDIWNRETPSIWNACIYPESASLKEAVNSAMNIYKVLMGEGDEEFINEWRNSLRHSLASSFSEADILHIIDRKEKIARKVELESFIKSLNNGQEMSVSIRQLNIQRNSAEDYIGYINKIAESSAFPQKMRLYLACADISKKFEINTDNQRYYRFEDKAYDAICNTIISATFGKYNVDFKELKIVKDICTIELPVRVNFCGSPSDAAPYCLEYGGTMLDGALRLKGKKPIKVTVKKVDKSEIRFSSFDQGCSEVFHDIREVRNCSNPNDIYALHKAVLVATGIIPLDVEDISMDELCKQIGGGLELLTIVDVPKGSGLGTSSIIAAAAVKAVNKIFGIDTDEERIYAQVFLVEQLMNTGGGWQDQVGGLTEGIKYFTALPGEYQKIEVDYLKISDSVMKELNDRFALIFSGQRRLARNVLREEMNQCIRNNKKALKTIKKIQEYCAIMRYYLMKGDITSFAKYITKQFELVKTLDKGASNTCIEYIFEVCDDLIDGKAICGAGGGGFLQVILKAGVTKEMLKKRICETFIDCGVEVWDCELI